MSDTVYGYRSGPRTPRRVLIDASTPSAPAVNDFMVLGTAGYYQVAAANEDAQCVMMQVSTDPASDGLSYGLADFSTLSIYEYPPDTGSATQALMGKAMDVGGAQSVNIDASSDGTGSDGCLECVGVNTDKNTIHVRLHKPLFAGA